MNPFVFDRPLTNEHQVDRTEELEALIKRFDDGVNTRMVSPRDYGKTTLLKAVCERLTLQGVPTVIVDLYGITNAHELVRRIEDAYDALPSGTWTSAIKGLMNRGGGAGINTPLGGMSGSLGAKDEEAALISALNLPKGLADKTGERVLVCFDEFQEVLKADLDGKIRSTIQHHGDSVTYVFCGSHVGMMEELFANRDRPFFNQAAPLSLGRFDTAALIDFLFEGFQRGNKSMEAVVDSYLEVVQGHPQRAMLAAHLLWDETPRGEAADFETLFAALGKAWPYIESEFEAVWDRLSPVESAVVKAVADGAASLRSKDSQGKYGLPASQSGQEAAERLARQGILLEIKPTKSPRAYRIDDPFFAIWVANGRKWIYSQ